MYANVFLEKSTFTFIKHFAWMISILLSFAILWIQSSMNNWLPTFSFFFFFENLIIIFLTNRVMKFWTFFSFENEFMNPLDFLEFFFVSCLKDFFFFLEYAFMNAWFLWNAYIVYVWMNFSLWENAFMNERNFFLECIYDVCLNDACVKIKNSFFF